MLKTMRTIYPMGAKQIPIFKGRRLPCSKSELAKIIHFDKLHHSSNSGTPDAFAYFFSYLLNKGIPLSLLKLFKEHTKGTNPFDTFSLFLYNPAFFQITHLLSFNDIAQTPYSYLA